MIVKNISTDAIPINGSVQIGVNDPDPNDGLILSGQTLNLSLSLNQFDLMQSEQLQNAIHSGDIVLVTGSQPLTQQESIVIYSAGPGEWADIFNDEVSKSILYGGMVSGFLYVNKCFIG